MAFRKGIFCVGILGFALVNAQDNCLDDEAALLQMQRTNQLVSQPDLNGKDESSDGHGTEDPIFDENAMEKHATDADNDPDIEGWFDEDAAVPPPLEEGEWDEEEEWEEEAEEGWETEEEDETLHNLEVNDSGSIHLLSRGGSQRGDHTPTCWRISFRRRCCQYRRRRSGPIHRRRRGDGRLGVCKHDSCAKHRRRRNCGPDPNPEFVDWYLPNPQNPAWKPAGNPYPDDAGWGENHPR